MANPYLTSIRNYIQDGPIALRADNDGYIQNAVVFFQNLVDFVAARLGPILPLTQDDRFSLFRLQSYVRCRFHWTMSPSTTGTDASDASKCLPST